jgi:hypothetical protein
MIVSLEYSWIWSFIGFILICLSIFIILRWLKDYNPPTDNFNKKPEENFKEEPKKEIEESFIRSQEEDVSPLQDASPIQDASPLQDVEFIIPEPKYEDIDITTCKGRSKGEKICCKAMEYMFNSSFNSVRPSFLKNPETGRNLEIDCYNEELKIAVEYNGIQHYKWPNFTGQSKEDFIRQLERDKMKKQVCKQKGIFLITVPYTVKHEDIPSYLHNMIKKYYKKI